MGPIDDLYGARRRLRRDGTFDPEGARPGESEFTVVYRGRGDDEIVTTLPPRNIRVTRTQQADTRTLRQSHVMHRERGLRIQRQDGVDRIALPGKEYFLARVAGRGSQRERLDIVPGAVVGRGVDFLPASGRP